MKDAALCKLPLSLTENSQGWDKNNHNNATVTGMTTEHTVTTTQHKNPPDDHEEWVARGPDNRVWRQTALSLCVDPGQAAQGVTLL